MAKDFYTKDEAADVLGMGPADVDRLVSEGRLRAEEQNGETVFRIEDVERIVANEGSSIVDLDLDADKTGEAAPADLSLSDPTSDIDLLGLDGSGIDLDIGPSPVVELTESAPPAKKPATPAKAPPKPAPPAAKGAAPVEEPSDIALADSSGIDLAALDEAARDTGLSASDVIALDEAIDEPRKSKGDTAIGNLGIQVFDDADLQIESDPMAKTHITAPADQEMALESIGSGSGLLDLTRESDDTSLGAELLDVISPSEASETETQAETIESDTGTLEAEAVETGTESYYDSSSVQTAEEVDAEPAMAMAGAESLVADPSAPAFTGVAFVATLTLLVTALAAISQVQGIWPDLLSVVDAGMNLYIFAGGLLGLVGIAWLIGWMVGRSGAKKTAAIKRAET